MLVCHDDVIPMRIAFLVNLMCRWGGNEPKKWAGVRPGMGV